MKFEFVKGTQKKSCTSRLKLGLSVLAVVPALSIVQVASADPSSQMFQMEFPGTAGAGAQQGAQNVSHVHKKKVESKVEWFKTSKILDIKRIDVSSEPAIEEKILSYISSRVFKYPDVSTLNALRHVIKTHEVSIPYKTVQIINSNEIKVFLAKNDLNMASDHIFHSVKSSGFKYKIGQVAVTGADPSMSSTLSKVATPGDELSAENLSDKLYAFSQIPGITRADSLISAGKALDTDNVSLNVVKAPMFSGSQIEVDNYGYAPTGALTTNITGMGSSVFTFGDQVYTTVSYSGGVVSGMVGYNRLIDLYSRYGVDFTGMSYTVGAGYAPFGALQSTSQFAALGVSGSNYSGDLWVSHYFKNTPKEKVFVKGTVFGKEYQDTYSPTVQNLRSLPGASAELSLYKNVGPWTGYADFVLTGYYLLEGSGSSNLNPFFYDTPGFNDYLTSADSLSYDLGHGFSIVANTNLQQYFGGGTLDPMLQATLGGVSNLEALPTASLFGDDLYFGQLTLNYKKVFSNGNSINPDLFFGVGNIEGIGTSYTVAGPGVGVSGTVKNMFGSLSMAVPVGNLPVEALGDQIPGISGGNIGSGGIPIELWASVGIHY